jgi:hypothetical protein
MHRFILQNEHSHAGSIANIYIGKGSMHIGYLLEVGSTWEKG